MKISRNKFWLWGLAVLFLGWIAIGYVFSSLVTRAKPSAYPAITKIDTFDVSQISLQSSDGLKINAWLAGNNKKNVVIFLAGIGANSSCMTGRAAIYLRNGFSVLLPDLRATGRSEGAVISFGWNERLDLQACFQYLESQGYENIAAHGCSLGAAAIAYSFNSLPRYDFVVMESSYDNIHHAFAHRTFDSGFNRLLFWPVYFFTEQKVGASSDKLSPEKCVRQYQGPVLYLAGEKEKQITPQEMQNVFEAIGSRQKTLHIFKGAGHFDFLQYDRDGYENILSDFLRSMPMQM